MGPPWKSVGSTVGSAVAVRAEGVGTMVLKCQEKMEAIEVAGVGSKIWIDYDK